MSGVNARTATAADFEAAAQAHARAFWVYAALAGITAYFFRWWAVIPALLATLMVIKSVGAGRAAQQLRAGTFPVPNPNNGAPEGDIANLRSPPRPIE